MADRTYVVYQNINNQSIFGENGDILANRNIPYIRTGESIVIDYNAINSDDITDLYTGFAPTTIIGSAIFDNNYDHYIDATLTVAASGAVTSIVANVAGTSFIGATGSLQLVNSSGQSESVDYSAASNVGTVYTFTVSATLSYVYEIGDSANVADSPLGRATTVDVTYKDTGRFLISISADSAKYLNDVEGLAAINNTRFELQVRDTEADLIYVAAFDFLALNVYDFTGAIPAPADGNYYTKIEIEALLLSYLKKDFSLLPFKTTLVDDDTLVINNSSSAGIPAEITWKTIKDNVNISDSVSGSFIDGDLVSGVLTVAHTFGLWRPAAVTLWNDSDQKIMEADSISVSSDTIEIDLSSFGTISGIWYYSIGSGGAAGDSVVDQYFTYDPVNDIIIVSKSMQIPPGTLYIGKGTVLNSGVRALNVRSELTGNKALLLAQLYDTATGFERAFEYNDTAIIDYEINDPAGTDAADAAILTITATADEMITKVEVETSTPLTSVPFDVVVKKDDDSGDVIFNLTTVLTTDSAGKVIIDMANNYNVLMFDAGFTMYIEITCANMLGVDTSPTFTPNMTFHVMQVERKELALTDEIPGIIGTNVIAGDDINVSYDSGTGETTISKLTRTHGGGYHIDSVSTTCAILGTQYKIDSPFTPWDSNNITWNGTLNRFEYTGAGEAVCFHVNWTACVSAGCDLTFQLYINGTNHNGIQRTNTFKNPVDKASLGMNGILTLATNDYIELFVESDTNGIIVDAREIQLTIG